jgi:hypothetical protein
LSITILGIAAYPADQVWDNVDLLARSVALNAPHTDLAFITAPLGDRDRRLFAEFGVRAIELADPVPTLADRTEADRRIRHEWMCGMFGSRHSWYETALASVASSHVLLADTRDVVVTGDLLKKTHVERLVLSQENAGYTIESDSWDRKWVVDTYGTEGLALIGQRPILCAGVVFGPVASIRQYVGAMRAELGRLGVEAVRRSGDQPVHNYLAYTGGLPPYEISTAESGWMRSVGLTPTQDLDFDWLRPGHNGLGNSTLVLHQYDRHVQSWKVCSAVRRTTGLAWWKNLYSPFDAHPGVRVARIGARLLRRVGGNHQP